MRTFVIHPDRLKERGEHIDRMMKRLGMDYEFVNEGHDEQHIQALLDQYMKDGREQLHRKIPRARRVETLTTLFANGFNDFNVLLKFLPRAKRVAGWWIRAFVRHPVLRGAAELFFWAYFHLAGARRNAGNAR